VDHGSRDETLKVAHEHGATVVIAAPDDVHSAFVRSARNSWILCLLPVEALAEELEAALFEWSEAEHEAGQVFSVTIREQDGAGWKVLPPEVRLANRDQINWPGDLPLQNPDAAVLAGHILRIPDGE